MCSSIVRLVCYFDVLMRQNTEIHNSARNGCRMPSIRYFLFLVRSQIRQISTLQTLITIHLLEGVLQRLHFVIADAVQHPCSRNNVNLACSAHFPHGLLRGAHYHHGVIKLICVFFRRTYNYLQSIAQKKTKYIVRALTEHNFL